MRFVAVHFIHLMLAGAGLGLVLTRAYDRALYDGRRWASVVQRFTGSTW